MKYDHDAWGDTTNNAHVTMTKVRVAFLAARHWRDATKYGMNTSGVNLTAAARPTNTP